MWDSRIWNNETMQENGTVSCWRMLYVLYVSGFSELHRPLQYIFSVHNSHIDCDLIMMIKFCRGTSTGVHFLWCSLLPFPIVFHFRHHFVNDQIVLKEGMDDLDHECINDHECMYTLICRQCGMWHVSLCQNLVYKGIHYITLNNQSSHTVHLHFMCFPC